MNPRKILHLDLDAFFCAVEELQDVSLQGKAFAVGGRSDARGVVASCSYAARMHGVHSAMPTSQALRLCPDLIIVPGRHGLYGEMSARVMHIIHNVSGLVEQVSIDEAFMDVSDLPQTSLQIATQLQSSIRSELNLPCSLGGASNKLVAKVATDVGKGRHRGATSPRAILIVPPGQEAAFLAPLPTRAIWGVGPKMEARLLEFDIHTLGQLAALPEADLMQNFGKWGHELSLRARGIDDSPILTEHEVKSISQEVTFDRDVADPDRLLETLRNMSEQVAYRLRQEGFCAATIRVKLRWSDFSTHTRQVTLSQPTDQDNQIFIHAQDLFQSIWQTGRPVRLLGVGASGLTREVHQFSLWENSTDKEHRLLQALDELRERYGKPVVHRGRNLKKSDNP